MVKFNDIIEQQIIKILSKTKTILESFYKLSIMKYMQIMPPSRSANMNAK